MLENLVVKNIALIQSAEIDFEKGLNVLTGETGAGKSIMLDSIGLLLGNRADKTLIRAGESFCKVVGKFGLDDYTKKIFANFCNKYSLECSDEILISRSFSLDGKTDIRINGEIVTLSMLKEIASFLVDSYMQNENQVLFDTNSHIKILDNFANIIDNKFYIDYCATRHQIIDIDKKLKTFGGNEQERLNTIDLLTYQINEIEKAKISSNEYEELAIKKQKMMNIGKIISNTTLAQNYLEQSAVDEISKSKTNLQMASSYDSDLQQYAERLDSVKIELTDILDSIKQYNESSDYSEYEQQKIDDRLDLYKSLMRKYGLTVEDVLNQKEEMQTKLEELKNAKEQIASLENEKQKKLLNCFEYAKNINLVRQNNAKILSQKIEENLKNLGMKNAKVLFEFNPIIYDEMHLFANGMDKVELMFSANLGETEKPLAKIASGGEISRFMLALKSVIASVDNMPTMIFDEIDTGISGATSESVAKQMAIIASKHQVISVTHSGQIASMADTNFLIYKLEEDGKTNTNIKKLNTEEKINEVARFMSGEKLSQSALLNAKDMIDEQNKIKNALKN